MPLPAPPSTSYRAAIEEAWEQVAFLPPQLGNNACVGDLKGGKNNF